MPTEQELLAAYYRGMNDELKRQRNSAQDQAAELSGQLAMLRLQIPVPAEEPAAEEPPGG